MYGYKGTYRETQGCKVIKGHIWVVSYSYYDNILLLVTSRVLYVMLK